MCIPALALGKKYTSGRVLTQTSRPKGTRVSNLAYKLGVTPFEFLPVRQNSFVQLFREMSFRVMSVRGK